MLNTQPTEPLRGDQPGSHLDVQDVFPTIQGEGPFAGTPAVFVRLAGCNLQCRLCDTDYTSKRQRIGVTELADKVGQLTLGKNRLVVITGGEPFRQNISTLVHMLHTKNCKVQIETNGTLPPTINHFDLEKVTIVCAPKTGKVHPRLLPHIGAYKYVLDIENAGRDGLPNFVLGHPAQPHVARPHEDFKGDVFLQPADEGDEEKNKANLGFVVTACLFYGYRLCLQQHKILKLP